MLLPGCWWTKEPSSAGFKDGVVGVEGWGGWIKNQSNWNGVWRRRTPCETVNHVPLLNMGSQLSLLFFFGPAPLCYMSLSPYVCLPLLALYAVILKFSKWGNKARILIFAVRWCERPPAGKSYFSRWGNHRCHIAPWHCGYNLPLCAFRPPSHAQQGLLMPLRPLTPQQWGRDNLCSLSQSNPHRTTLVHWRWIQGAAFGGADTAALFHRGPH